MRHVVGVITALPQEARALNKKCPEVGNIEELTPNLFLGISGMGYQAAKNLAYGLMPFCPNLLISWGTAAALRPELKAGTVIIPNSIVDADGIEYEPDQVLNTSLIHLLHEKNIDIHKGRLIGQSSLLGTPKNKRDLFRKTGAVAADMESAAIASVAREKNIPFVAIRVITDGVDTRIPYAVVKASDDSGIIHPMTYLLTVIKQPKDWIPTLQLAMDFYRAKKSLKQIAVHWEILQS